jgi:hypothetical protein
MGAKASDVILASIRHPHADRLHPVNNAAELGDSRGGRDLALRMPRETAKTELP